jgi:PAS domain S-box-containing protein
MNLLQKTKPGSSKTESVEDMNERFAHEDYPFINLDLVPFPAAYINKDSRYEYINKAYAEWYGTSSESIIGKTSSEFLGPEIYDRIKDHIKKALAGEKVIYEIGLPYKNSKRSIEVIYTPQFDKEGNVKGYLGILNDVTDKLNAQIKLEASEERYRSLIYELPAAVYTTDKDGYINLYNEAAAELWGRRPELGKEIWCGSWKIYEPDGITPLPLDSCPMAITLKEGRKVYGTEIIVERPDGLRKNVQPYPQPIFDAEGNLTGAINLLLDVTDRKIAEEQRAKLAAIVDSSGDAIISKTLEGIITSWNNAAERIFGYSAAEMVNEPVTKIIPPDRLNEEQEIIQRLKKGECIEHFETERLTKDGKKINVSLTISPVKDSSGKIMGVSKIARDITERTNTEELNARLAAIVQSSDDAIVSKTLNGIVTSWNNAAEKLFGYTEKEMIGQSITKVIPNDRLDEEPQILGRLRKGERVDHFETKRITKDGKLLDISLTISPIINSSGKIIGVSKIARDITLQKEAERLIHENQERFRMAVETTNLGTWEYSPRDSKLYCSPESRKICGLPAEINPDFDLLFNYISEEDKDYFMEQVKKAINPAGNGDFDMLLRIHRYDDRELRWVRAQGKVFFNSSLFPERLIGTMLDITEEKTKEEELKESVELFETMADNVPAMIWMSGTDKFDDYFNKTWLQFTGKTLEEESNEGWLEGVHPDDVQKCIDTYNTSFKEQKGFYAEYRLRRHDGEYRWISDNSVPRFSPEGDFLGFISACIDIDDQKRFREKIQESELLFKTISNASPAALWMTNENEENVFISDTWLKWTGKNFNEVIQHGWVQSVAEEDKIVIVNKFRECFKKRKYFNAEFRFIKADGEIRWGLTEGYPFYDFNGDFSGYAGSVTDITEIKKLEQRKDDFIKMASHELKTPITSINGYVQLLMNIYNEADDQKLHLSRPTVKSSLTTISKQVVKLTRLVTELLDLSKIESGKLELHKTEFDLADLVEETVQDVRHIASKHAIIVYNEFEGKVVADKDRIAQVILNLLTNAIKYSPNADKVEVYVEGNKKMAIIRVKDYGIGIDKKDQLRIFERFYRVEGKSEQTFPGFGIGLFIASETIQRHHGTISVESEKGKGSVFTITLPLQKKN